MTAPAHNTAAFEQCSLRAFPTVMEMSKSFGTYVVDRAVAAIASHGRFDVAVSGGSVVEVRPRPLLPFARRDSLQAPVRWGHMKESQPL